MKLPEWMFRLAPTQERRQIDMILKQIEEELDDHTLPSVGEFQSIFNENNSHPLAQSFIRAFQHQYRSQEPMTDTIASLYALRSNLDEIKKIVKKSFNREFSTRNMTYEQANIIRYIELALFYTQYFRKFMLYFMSSQPDPDLQTTKGDWSKAVGRFIDDNMRAFIKLYPSVRISSSELSRTFSNITNAEVNPDGYDVVRNTVGTQKIDPMGLFGGAGFYNPVWEFGKAIAEWQVRRYDAAKQEDAALRLRLQEYRELKESGKASPKLQKLIEHTEKRVEDLDYKIHKFEEKNMAA